MIKNECFLMTAERLGAEMEGICRRDGMAVFVPGLLPGEEALVRIVKAEKRYAYGRIENPPATPSPMRQDPGCAAYPRCGGCTARHMRYEATLEAKRQQVADCLERIGGLSVPVLPVLGMENPVGYRNKTALPVGGTADAPALGFYAPRSHALVPVHSCPNAQPPTNAVADAFLAWMREEALAPYDERTRKGVLRHLVIRVNRSGTAMVTVVANAGTLKGADRLMDRLQPLGVRSLWLNENREANNVILSPRFHHLAGDRTLQETLLGLTFTISPGAFFQVNLSQTEKLYETAAKFAALRPDDLLCDVYCGAGTITLTLARSCRQAVGIEIFPAAVENARENARRNGIGNAVFYAGKAEEQLPRLVAEGLRPDVIVVDPPRKGLEEAVIHAITKAGPERLVYVSCNPATLARDLKGLTAGGYSVQQVQPVDMFCWTAGIETVCLLKIESRRRG